MLKQQACTAVDVGEMQQETEPFGMMMVRRKRNYWRRCFLQLFVAQLQLSVAG